MRFRLLEPGLWLKGTTSKKITVDKEAIQSLPIRDLSDLYALQSGVVKVESRTKSVPDHEERGIEEIRKRWTLRRNSVHDGWYVSEKSNIWINRLRLSDSTFLL